MVKKTVDKIESKNRPATTSTDVSKFLTRTGFILEMEVVEVLEKLGYLIQVNRYFHDYDHDKKREIDIIATKRINDVVLVLIIECKQSLVDDWIFICSDKKPSRYYQYLKHTPECKDIDKTKIFDDFHVLNSSIPLAQNYIIRDKFKDRKSTSEQVETCIEKLPKALVDIVDSKKSGEQRYIYLPIAVFSGQIFAADYKGKLETKGINMIQYETNMSSENYIYHMSYALPMMGLSKQDSEEKKNSAVALTSNGLGYKYLIDFVTKDGLSQLASDLETKIKKIKLADWSIRETINK